MDYTKIKVLAIENIDMADYPQFTDAFIDQADLDGVEMTKEQLEEINNNSDFISKSVLEQVEHLKDY